MFIMLATASTVFAADQPGDADYLLTSSATDFHAHQPPTVIDFRRVHLVTAKASDGVTQPMLCGEFLASEGSGKPSWQPFVTIKTSKYEQWLGTQATTLCNKASASRSGPDLSAELKARLHKLD
jgi:hypothetical protein